MKQRKVERSKIEWKCAQFSRTVSVTYTNLLTTQQKLYFSFSSILSLEDKSILSATTAKCIPRRVRCIILRSSGRRRRGETSINGFHPFAPFEVSGAFSDQLMALNSLKLFNRRSQDLHFIVRKRWVKDCPYTASAAVYNSPFALLRGFLQYVMSFTEPYNLQRLGFPLSDDG